MRATCPRLSKMMMKWLSWATTPLASSRRLALHSGRSACSLVSRMSFNVCIPAPPARRSLRGPDPARLKSSIGACNGGGGHAPGQRTLTDVDFSAVGAQHTDRANECKDSSVGLVQAELRMRIFKLAWARPKRQESHWHVSSSHRRVMLYTSTARSSPFLHAPRKRDVLQRTFPISNRRSLSSWTGHSITESRSPCSWRQWDWLWPHKIHPLAPAQRPTNRARI